MDSMGETAPRLDDRRIDSLDLRGSWWIFVGLYFVLTVVRMAVNMNEQVVVVPQYALFDSSYVVK